VSHSGPPRLHGGKSLTRANPLRGAQLTPAANLSEGSPSQSVPL
jgi:hypothetical protein